MTLVDQLAAWLAGELPDRLSWTPSGVFWTPGSPQPALAPVTVAGMPAGPDRACGLYITPVEIPAGVFEDEVPLQVRTRGPADGGPAVSEADAEAVRQVLRDAYHVRLPGGAWLAVARVHNGRPGYLGPDQNRRHEHVVNARLRVGQSTA